MIPYSKLNTVVKVYAYIIHLTQNLARSNCKWYTDIYSQGFIAIYSDIVRIYPYKLTKLFLLVCKIIFKLNLYSADSKFILIIIKTKILLYTTGMFGKPLMILDNLYMCSEVQYWL
jgi:hypothetical protein